VTGRPPPRIAAIVLAAGASSRMGSANKLLEHVDGEAIVRRVVGALAAVPLVERIVVTGADAERVSAALSDLDVRFVHNPAYAEGIASSIRAGVAALPAGLDGALIVPGDMPWLSSADIVTLQDAFDPDAGRAICVPVRAGRRGNPVLWAARHFEALARLTGDTGGRQLFGRLARELAEVPVPGDGVLVDVDTPEELQAARCRPPRARRSPPVD
jgi:molybdenum cofactor cytidylyltransferase